jgi:hypothetical protein
LPALRDHVHALLAQGTPVIQDLAAVQAERIEQAFNYAGAVANENRSEQARQVATGLYHVVTMAAMRWEAKQANMPMRSHLADLILKHRLAARDPLQSDNLNDAALCAWLSQTV